jgi:hypothetical protein
MLDRQLVELAKERLTIFELWRRLQLPGEPRASCCSPFRDEKHASFSIFANGQLAHDHTTGATFDGPKFLAEALHLPIGQALKTFISMAGCNSMVCPYQQRAYAKESEGRPKPIQRPDLSKFWVPTWQEVRQVAFDRRLDPAAPLIAKRLGCLRVGYVCGHRSWILTDPAGFSAEGRRFGRLNYPACGELHPRKAHAIKGSCKAWPVGLGIEKALIEKASLILFVEGGPDWLASWDLIYFARAWGITPVALLGRGVHGLRRDALELLKNKRVRFVPHLDPDNGALKQVDLITDQLRQVGCQTSVFDLSGLLTKASRPPKDLCDAIHATGRGELAESLLCKPSSQTNDRKLTTA